ncbi:hypothetical protein WJX72_001263 [[Myrmecia] bisecta]|uniref:Uncharacterized protein n=1 Tax=[Myrmecia] bisecta TaxID=41462 RepID=A0AAW1PNB2_9CHLO
MRKSSSQKSLLSKQSDLEEQLLPDRHSQTAPGGVVAAHFNDGQDSSPSVSLPVSEDYRLRNRGKLWTPDRGTGFYQAERQRHHVPSLVETGRHAGRSRVQYTDIDAKGLNWHIWKRDFFTSAINVRLPLVVAYISAAYLITFAFWGLVWYAVWRWDRTCLHNVDGFLSSFIFAVVTQQTIGYGNAYPADCWLSGWLLAMQAIISMLLDAVTIGIIFARISHPMRRGRTIFISDSAVVARRDGILKFMFRVCDIRQTGVVSPVVKAWLYTFKDRHTAEGELIPAHMERLELLNEGANLLLPVTVEHTIDERSPLWGHTQESLMAMQAEIIVTFEGSSEHGDQFMARRSYLPSEIHWGFVFTPCLVRAAPGTTHHTVDLSTFHEIEPQSNLGLMPSSSVSRAVVARPKASVPYPWRMENTLVLSDMICVASRDGQLRLMFRLGDTYPNQMLEVCARAYLYRWRERTTCEGERLPYEMHRLDLGEASGRDQPLLRLPVVLHHVIDSASPLANWTGGPPALAHDADSEIVVVVEAVVYSTTQPVLCQRTYAVHSDVKWGFAFTPCVTRAPYTPEGQPDGRLEVNWQQFHSIAPIEMPAPPPLQPPVPRPPGRRRTGEAADGPPAQHPAPKPPAPRRSVSEAQEAEAKAHADSAQPPSRRSTTDSVASKRMPSSLLGHEHTCSRLKPLLC